MKHRVTGILVLALIVGLAPPVGAVPIPITATDGTWSNAVPPGVTIDNTTDPRTVRWGVPIGAEQSGYDWSPRATPFDAQSDGTPFSLGTFVHLNFPIGEPFLQSVDLDFTLTIDGLAPLAGAFAFTHNETPNAAPCTPPGATICPDVVSVASPFLNTPFSLGGANYFFSLLGFSQDGGTTITSEFVTEEEARNVADLYAVITERPISTPEPASLLLLGSGLLGLGTLGWRLKRR